VVAQGALAIVDRARARVPAVLRVDAVAQDDDDVLVLIALILGGRVERRAGGERLPAPGEPDRLVGVARRHHGVDLVVERVAVRALGHQRGGAAGILLGREQGAGRRRRVQGVVVLVAIGDAAVPGAVTGRRPRPFVADAAAVMAGLDTAGPVLLVPV